MNLKQLLQASLISSWDKLPGTTKAWAQQRGFVGDSVPADAQSRCWEYFFELFFLRDWQVQSMLLERVRPYSWFRWRQYPDLFFPSFMKAIKWWREEHLGRTAGIYAQKREAEEALKHQVQQQWAAQQVSAAPATLKYGCEKLVHTPERSWLWIRIDLEPHYPVSWQVACEVCRIGWSALVTWLQEERWPLLIRFLFCRAGLDPHAGLEIAADMLADLGLVPEEQAARALLPDLVPTPRPAPRRPPLVSFTPAGPFD